MSTLTRLWIKARRKKDEKMLEIIRAIKHEGFKYPAAGAFWIKESLRDNNYGSIAQAVEALRNIRPDSHEIISWDDKGRSRTQVHGAGYRFVLNVEFEDTAVIDSFGRMLCDSKMPRDPRW